MTWSLCIIRFITIVRDVATKEPTGGFIFVVF